jgi:hypothetical protein
MKSIIVRHMEIERNGGLESVITKKKEGKKENI